ncbi:hypothetical protein ACFQ78_34255 [Streptomyces sp. NPDC056519]|uniref:hypothetical protein n=1 Tax=Streptomyces sp. NPDC056519 TaxID=3345849 RepID=UPI00369920BC
MGIAAATACAVLSTATTATAAPRPAVSMAVAPRAAALVDQQLVNQLVRDVTTARATLAAGESTTVYDNGDATVTLRKQADGSLVLAGGGSLAAAAAGGFCHSAAMMAVYGLGAAVLGAAAAAGGITIVGIAVSAEAASALSSALAIGSGVSGLVSMYIC